MKSLYVTAFSFFLLFITLPSWTDEIMEPAAYVKSAYGGKFYFKMLPGDKDHPLEGQGILYRIDPLNGIESVWWKISGWYSRSVYISPNGEYLVRLNDGPWGGEPEDDDLGIAFYNVGKLIKKYSTKDLVKEPSAVTTTIAHYDYLKEIKGFTPENDNYTFTIVTIDNIEYQFNVPSGDIISEKKLK